jgi:hypothetical protein
MLYGLPEKYFLRTLLWDLKGPGSRHSGDTCAPSWSGAGWTGAVTYKNHKGVLACPVKFYFSQNGHPMRPLVVDEDWNFDYTYLSLVERLRLADITSTSEPSPPNTGEGELLLSFKRLGARRRPGYLLFRTTCADLVILPDSNEFGLDRDQSIFGLFSRDGTRVGRMETNLELPGSQSRTLAFVLCAQRGFQRPRGRIASTRSRLSGLDPSRRNDAMAFLRRDRSHWSLRALAIEEIDGVAYRVGLGLVDETLWELAKSTLKTVVLA